MWRKRKVDEWVVVGLLNRAKDEIDDPTEVNRLLREVGKFFDPLTGKAMLEGSVRAEILALLDRGAKADALATIDRHIENFQRRVELETSARSCVDQPACAAPPGPERVTRTARS